LQQWIRNGQVLINTAPWRGKDKVKGGEKVQVTAQLEEEVQKKYKSLHNLKKKFLGKPKYYLQT